MTEERYNEIDNMKPEDLETLSEEEYKEYNVSRYLKLTSQRAALENLAAHIETAQQGYLNIWPTGFTELDKKLDGGFLGGNLIILGAISSLGKTSFAMQIADQIAGQGKDVLVFSLEMSKNELNAKSISRNTYKLTYAGVCYDSKEKRWKDDYSPRQQYRLTTSDILRGRIGGVFDEKRKLFEEAIQETQKLNSHLFILRDNTIDLDQLEHIVKTHIEATGRQPFVIVDYLQILKAREASKTTDKRLRTDEDVNGLKDLAEKLRVPILLISSFNRTNYLEPANMGSFKESGGIEYSSDTLIALQYSGMEYRKHWMTTESGAHKLVYENKIQHDDRVRQLLEEMDKTGAEGGFLPIDVKLLKNRGVSKGTLYFDFCPKYNIFRERPEQSDSLNWDDPIEEVDENLSGKKSLGKV